MNRTIPTILLGAVVALVVGCSDNDVCTDAEDCFRGEVCVDNLCVIPGENNVTSPNGTTSNGTPNGTPNATTSNGTPNATTSNGTPNATTPNSTTPNTTTPNNTNGGEVRPVELVGGGEFTCALMSNAEVWCWGENTENRLGTELSSEDAIIVPEKVLGLSDVVALTAGESHACARDSQGSTLCWGENRDIDTTKDWGVVVPPSPIVITDVTEFDANHVATCAASGDGRLVSCFGRGDHVNEFPPNFEDPVTQIAAGKNHACALAADAVWCWGADGDSQLGFGTPVRDTGRVVDIDAGEDHTCVVNGDGNVLCWGSNETGQLGTIPTDFDPESDAPQLVEGMSGTFLEVASGGAHSCALNDAGRVWCWGGWSGYEPGEYNNGDLTTPITPTGMGSGVVQISAGWVHTCALKADASVWCWGDNSSRQLGVDRAFFRTKDPVRVTFP